MNAARRVALWTGIVAWIYSWSYFRGLREEAVAGLSTGTAILMGVASTVLIASAVGAGLRASIWPALAIVAALLMVAFVVLGQQAVMNDALESVGEERRAGFGDALTSVLRSRSSGGLIIVSLLPLLLLLSGITGLLRRGDRATKEVADG